MLRRTYASLMLAPLIVVYIRVQMFPWLLPGLPSSAAWWVHLIPAILSVLAVSYLAFAVPAVVREPAASRLRLRGRDPQQTMVLLGAIMLLTPVNVAFFCTLLGLPIWELVVYAGLSLGGLAIWRWRHIIRHTGLQAAAAGEPRSLDGSERHQRSHVPTCE
jgi:hypothetical protein